MSSQPPPKPASASAPISTLATPLAQSYTHIHPLLLLSTFFLSFHSLVADPVGTLTYSLIPVAGLQAAYAVICLPVTDGGSAVRERERELELEREKEGKKESKGSSGSKRPTPKKARKSAVGISGRVFTTLLSLLFAALPTTPLLFALLILFGAPLTTHLAETALCAAHLALLVAVPLVYVHGVEGESWREVLSLLWPVDEIMGGVIGAALGAWVGAVPIPLDWDREWQKWPVTIITGAYLGYAVGKTVGGLPFVKGRRITFE